MFRFPRAVWLLGFVSLATDAATEAIYPILPFFLTRVLHAGALSLGVVEGAAEAANSILKIWSGRAADRPAVSATARSGTKKINPTAMAPGMIVSAKSVR